uniref:Alstrom syndrome protein 1 isoform X2 n=1 Tax=Jaculus jaculus TaxID=51337 RepID=UPI001E1B1EEB|nr:Alstrom syndrome protein 1 isoform X2 [Jaculus jaculus]
MEPEDLPSPGELEEEEDKEEEEEEAEVEKQAAEEPRDSEETVNVEEEAGPESDSDFQDEFQELESTDEEEDDEAKAWLQAYPGRAFPLPPPPRHLYAAERPASPETFGQCDLSGGYVELADIETLLDDLCDSSLFWQTTSQVLSEKDSNFGKPRGNLGSNQPFSSTFPPCIPHEPTSESECHSSNLRMLRVSPDTVPKSLEHLAGDTCNGDIVESIQSKLKSSIIGDSDIETHSCLSIEDLPNLDVSFPKENIVGLHTDNVNQKALTDSHLTKERLKVSNITEPSDQNTGTSTTIFTPYSQRKKSNILYQEGLPDDNKIDQARTVSIVSGPTDQKSDVPILTSASYSQREKPDISYWQHLSGSHLPEEVLKISEYSDPEAQKTRAQRASATSYSQPQRPTVYYPQALPYSAVAGHTVEPGDQKTGAPATPSASYSQRQRPSVYFQQPLTDGPLPEETLKVSDEPIDQTTGTPRASSANISQRQRPSVHYSQILPGGPLPQETLKTLDDYEPVDQKTVAPTASTASYSQKQRPSVHYSQILPGGPLPQETLKALEDYEPVDQKTVAPTASTASYSQRQRPSVHYSQILPGGPLPQETLKTLDDYEPVDQKTVAPTASTASYSQKQRPSVHYSQILPGGPLPQETLKTLEDYEPVDQKTVAPIASTASYSQRQRPSVHYSQILPGSRLPEETLKVLEDYEPVDQKTVAPAASTASYSQRQRPSVHYSQILPGGPLPEETLKALDDYEPVDQKIMVPTASTASYSQKQRPSVHYSQILPGGPLPQETLKTLEDYEPVDQKTVAPTASTASYSQRQRPSVHFSQILPGGPLPQETLKALDDYEPVDQKTVAPTASTASYSQKQRASAYSSQALSDGALPEETLKVSDEPIDHKTGTPEAPSASYSQTQRPIVYYQQPLIGGPLPEETLKVSDEPVDQMTGTPRTSSASISQRQRPSVHYVQILLGGAVPEEISKASDDYEPVDQKTMTPTASTASYLQRQRPSVYSLKALPDGALPEEALKFSDEPVDQKTVTPKFLSDSYSQRQRPNIYYQQSLSGGLLSEEALKALDKPVDQMTVMPTTSVASYLQRQRPSVHNPQALPGGLLPEGPLKASDDYEPVDLNTGTLTAPATSYSQRQRASAYYPQSLPGGFLPEEVLKALDEPVDQKTMTPRAFPASFSQKQSTNVYYPQALPGGGLLEDALQGLYEPVEHKTVTPKVSAASYLQRPRPVVSYPQVLLGGPLPEEALTALDEPVEHRTGTPRVSSASILQRQRPGVHYPQILLGSSLSEGILKASDGYEPVGLQKTMTPTASAASQRQGPSVYTPQAPPGSLPPEEALKVSDEPTDQKIVTPRAFSASISQTQRPGVYSPQGVPGGPLPEEALKALDEPIDQGTMIPTASTASYIQKQKPSVYTPQALPGGLPKEDLKVSDEPIAQKTGAPTLPSASYSQRQRPSAYYPLALAGGSPPEGALKASDDYNPVEQKTVTPTMPDISYFQRQRSSLYYPEALAGSPLPDKGLNVSNEYELVDSVAGTGRLSSASYSQRQRPSIYFQQALSGGPVSQEALKISNDHDLVDQKTAALTSSSAFSSQSQRPSIYYQQALPGGPLPEKALKISYEPIDQKTETQRMSSVSHPQKRPTISSQDALLGGAIPQEPWEVSDNYEVELNTGIPTVSTALYSQRQRPTVYYQPAVPSGLPEEALIVSKDYGPVDQKTATSRTSSASFSQRQRPGVYYPQALSDGPLLEEALKVLGDSEPVDQKTRIPTPSSQNQRPSVYQQHVLPGGILYQEALKVSDEPLDQEPGTPISYSESSSQRQRPGVYLQQPLPHGPLPENALKVSDDYELLEQKSGTPTIAYVSSSQRQIPNTHYQQAFPGSHLFEESLKASVPPEPADQKTGTSATSSSSYPSGKESTTFYHQALPSSHLPEESPKVSTSPLSADQKTGTPTISSHSYPFVEKSIIFYQNDFPNSPLTTETLNVSAISGPAEQKTSPTSEPSCSYSFGEKAIIFYQQALPGVQLTNESVKVSVIPGPIAQKTEIPTVNSSSYPDEEKTIVSYQQVLPDSHLTENTVNVSVVPGPTDQKSEIPTVSSTSYSHREKLSVSYQQEAPDLSEKALKVLGPAKQKTGIQTVSSISYAWEEKPTVTYQQELPGLTEGALKTVGVVPGPTDQKDRIQIVSPSSYSGFPQQELPNINEKALGTFVLPRPVVHKVGTPTEPLSYYSQREESAFTQQESPVIDLTDEVQKVSAASLLTVQKTGTQTEPSSSYFHTEKLNDFYPQTLPDNNLTEDSLKALAVPGLSDQNRRPIVPPSSYSYEEKLKISTVNLPDIQKTELPTSTLSNYSQREKSTVSTKLEPDDQKTLLPTVFHGSCPKRETPGAFLQQQLPYRDQSEDILKISTVPEPTDTSTGIPVLLSGSYSPREEYNSFCPQELPDRHLTEGVLKVTIIPEPADKKTVLVTALPSSFSHRGKRSISYQNDLTNRHLTEDALKVSSGLGQTDQIAGSPTVSPGAYSHGDKHKLVSEHVQRLIDDLNSPDSYVSSNSMPLNSQVDDADVINKPESSVLGDAGCEEIQDTDHSSKTLKEIRSLLMEAENIALKRCNFPATLVPFRDVNDVPCVQSNKVVCFKEPSTSDVSHDIHQREPITDESPRVDCIQKDIGTQTNLKCQQGIENWEFFSSTTIRSPLPEAGSMARTTLDETFRHYQAAKSVMRSEPEGCCSTIGNKIIIPMMTIIKSDSSSDVSDGCCSWDSNLPETLESVSDVLLNFFPHTPFKTSIADSRDEEGLSESEDGCGSVDSLATHVKHLLQCESSLNHARQILKNAEEEECRVRARAWNMKFNLGHECGYSISELNEDDRRKVEEIKAKLFGHGRATHVSEGLQSPWGIGCKPEAVCSHIIIESHEKGCFRTLNVEQPQLDSHSCAFKSAGLSEVIQGRQSPSSWRAGHNLSKSLDQNNHHFKVGNSLQLQSHSPFQQLTPDDFKVSKDVEMPPFHANTNTDSWLSELAEPTCVPPKGMDFPSTSQTPPPEPMKQFTTSITFSSHRHSKCISDTSVFKVGVTEGSQYTGTSVGIFNSHVTEEQNSPRDLKKKTFSPSSLKRHSHIPGKEVAILVHSRQNSKLPAGFEHSHQEEKLLERSNLKGNHSEHITSTNYSNSKGVQFSDNHTLISMGKPSSTLEVKEKNVIITPDLPSCIFLEQRELFEKSQALYTDHHMRKHHSPPCPDIPSCIFLGQQQLIEQSKAPHLDHEMRESHSFFSQSQENIILDLPSPIFLEEHQCRSPDVDDHMTKQHVPLSQGQDCVVEKIEYTTKSHICKGINAETEFSNVVSQSPPNHCTLVTSECTPPSNRKALSCVRITLCPKTPSKLDSGILNERFHSLDPASKTRINSELNSDLQTISSRSLEPASKLLTSKPIAQNTESLDFLGPKSLPDLQVIRSPLPDSKTITKDLKTIPTQDSQIVTSKQTQVNISDLEGYSKPEGTSVSADGSPGQSNIPFSASSGKLSSDAVTQITTESPEKTMFLSEIFINTDDNGHEGVDLSTQKTHKVPVKVASSPSVQQVTTGSGPDAQPVLLPYKPSGSSKMYYVPQLQAVPSVPDSKSDTTIESSHSGSNDAIAPNFPAQVLGTRNDDLPATVNIKHKEGIYSKRAVTKGPLSMRKTLSQKDDAGSSGAVAVQVQDRMTESLPGTKTMTQKEEIHNKKTIPKEVCPEEKEALDLDLSESECHSEFENTTHSVFRSAKFYFHRPVHPPNDQDFCHESLGRSVFMRHSWKDFFHHHSDTHREHICLSPPYPLVDKTMVDYTRIKSLSIDVNVEDNKMMHTKSQARDPKNKRQINDSKRDQKVTPEVTTQHTVSLNELWSKYQERQKQQKPPDVCDRKELSLVERLDRLAKLLQNPITHSLQASERDNSRGRQNVKGWSYGKQQKSKLQKQCKSLERGHEGDFRKGKVLSHQPGRSNQIKIEQIKFDKYILSKQPNFNYISNTTSDSRPSEESDLLTDSPTYVLSSTTSPVDSDILTQTDKDVTLHERSSSISTIDTARLIHAFGHERLCLSPRRIKLYSSITNQQKRYLEKRCKHNKKSLSIGHPQMTSEHTKRRHIQVANSMISSDCVSSSSSVLSLNSALYNEQNVHMLNKGVQAGNLEIVTGAKKHTRDVGVTFPTPSSSEARLEEDSDMTSWSEEIVEEKMFLANNPGEKKLRKNKNSCEGVSWFVPVGNMKSGSQKENLPKSYGPGVSWFEPVTKTKPWREPLREQNLQGRHMDCQESLGGPGGDDGQGPLKPFVRATLQEALQLHRPDFISRSGERIKRLKLIVKERKLQNMFQCERNALFNAPHPLSRRIFLAVQKSKPIGKKEMIQRSKRIYEQLPEVKKKREEEKRKSEYKTYRLRAQLYKTKVTNQLLGRKVPWD